MIHSALTSRPHKRLQLVLTHPVDVGGIVDSGLKHTYPPVIIVTNRVNEEQESRYSIYVPHRYCLVELIDAARPAFHENLNRLNYSAVRQYQAANVVVANLPVERITDPVRFDSLQIKL